MKVSLSLENLMVRRGSEYLELNMKIRLEKFAVKLNDAEIYRFSKNDVSPFALSNF